VRAVKADAITDLIGRSSSPAHYWSSGSLQPRSSRLCARFGTAAASDAGSAAIRLPENYLGCDVELAAPTTLIGR